MPSAASGSWAGVVCVLYGLFVCIGALRRANGRDFQAHMEATARRPETCTDVTTITETDPRVRCCGSHHRADPRDARQTLYTLVSTSNVTFGFETVAPGSQARVNAACVRLMLMVTLLCRFPSTTTMSPRRSCTASAARPRRTCAAPPCARSSASPQVRSLMTWMCLSPQARRCTSLPASSID